MHEKSRTRRQSWLSAAVVLLAACGFEDREIETNGQSGVLFAYIVDGDELRDSAALPVGKITTLCIERRERVHSGNGLGDSTTYTTLEDFTGRRAEVALSPPDIARLTAAHRIDSESAPDIASCIVVDIVGESEGPAELSVTIEGYTDSWILNFE